MIYTFIATIYCLIAALFNCSILKEYANDKSDSLKDIPPALFKAIAFLLSVFWFITISWALIENLLKKEEKE